MSMERGKVRFISGDTECAAWRYPGSNGACVVMAAADKHLMLDAAKCLPSLLWPALRAKVTQPGHVAVLDAMEAEHARIDPLVSRVDASLAATDGAGLVENTGALAGVLTAHMEHEEDQALPLVEAHLGPRLGRVPEGRRGGMASRIRPYPALEHRHNLTRTERPTP